MPDEVDRSELSMELHNNLAIEKARQEKSYGTPRIKNGRHECLDCEDLISKERLEASPNAVLCVQCQELREEWK